MMEVLAGEVACYWLVGAAKHCKSCRCREHDLAALRLLGSLRRRRRRRRLHIVVRYA